MSAGFRTCVETRIQDTSAEFKTRLGISIKDTPAEFRTNLVIGNLDTSAGFRTILGISRSVLLHQEVSNLAEGGEWMARMIAGTLTSALPWGMRPRNQHGQGDEHVGGRYPHKVWRGTKPCGSHC